MAEVVLTQIPDSTGGTLALAGAALLTLSLVAALILNCASPGKKKAGSPPAAPQKSSSRKPSASAAEDHRERCTILFGTQTGTAERFAKALRSQLDSKYGANTAFDVVDIEHYDGPARLPKERLVFFLVATYGDGEPTDNAAEFYNWLEKQAKAAPSEGSDLCKGVSYGVFGLGNRQYEHFCAVGKRMHEYLGELGAAAVVRCGTGDDDRDIDEDFDAWSADLFAALSSSPLLKAGRAAALTADAVAAYEVERVEDAPAEAVDAQPSGSGAGAASPYLATVAAVRELHAPGSDRSCVHVELDIAGAQATYEAGDHVAVFPENAAEVVEAAARALDLPLNAAFRLRLPAVNPGGLPEPPSGLVTLRCILSRHADLLSAPGKGALQALAAFASEPAEAARLKQLASIGGRDAYHAYVVQAKRSLLEVLQDFPSARPSLGAFLGSVAPRLQPRFYSISSSPALHPRSVHVTCAVVQETMPTGRLHRGVASTYLASAAPGDAVPVFVRRSAFKLPRDPATPVVMVGPGTGVAPFRGFVQERAALLRGGGGGGGGALGVGVLFFGCRRREHDYIYREELEAAVASGALTSLSVAFSRAAATKDYVQHHLQRRAEEVWALLRPEAGGVLYVCGDAKGMAKDVHRALHEVVQRCTGCGDSEAEEAVKALADGGRYLKDVW